ncbi:hypothetical protein ANCDUO_15954 [Ancylostoma duodenale]|uniref:Uncharacterized protein n=1 Tax=Ancylostoma duodenale TaxID=51022 RepID=A0A0C2CC67_9BILA|nr:hypothetical protein ANCDUO_15954 [Ancylostoma duodenale]
MVFYLQNHDIVIKSPYEIAEIYSLLGGANDVQVTRCAKELCNYDENWYPSALNFFINGESFGLDEIMLATLQVSDELGMPGGFTSDCLEQGKDTASISR